MQRNKAKLVHSGVDYLTASIMLDKLTSTDEIDRGVTLAADLIRREESAGNDLRPFHMKGFDGLTCGAVSVGKSGRGMLFRLSSHAAAERWREVYDLSTNVSRLDVAATVRLEGEWLDLSRVHLEEARAYQSESAPHMRVTRIDGGKHGNTLMVGSRSSDAYGRIYDKYAESRDKAFQDCWRYEVEFKRGLANDAAQLLSGERGIEVDAAVMASSWFGRRHITPAGLLIGGTMPSGGERRSDDLKRLCWLRSGVRASVATLAKNGLLCEALTALGLSDSVLSSAGYHRQAPTKPQETD